MVHATYSDTYLQRCCPWQLAILKNGTSLAARSGLSMRQPGRLPNVMSYNLQLSKSILSFIHSLADIASWQVGTALSASEHQSAGSDPADGVTV